MSRTFTASGIPGLSHSVFHSNTPISSAKKAFNSVCKQRKTCNKVVSVIDKNTMKKYSYKVKRVSDPKNVVLNGTPVHFNFETIAHSVNSKIKPTVSKHRSKHTVSKPRTHRKHNKKSLRKCVIKCLKK
jgi:hypothetical protein